MTEPRGEFRILKGRDDVDIDAVHAFLTTCYWAEGIPRDIVEKSVHGSLPFSIYCGDRQIGFARVITDECTYAYLSDVYVLEEFRGKGLGRWLIDTIMADSRLQNLRRFALFTRNAHSLYQPFGFKNSAHPERYLEIVRPGLYKSK